MTAYAIGLWAISCIPIVGGIISGLVALSDLLVGWITGSGWSQRVMEALVDFFVTTDELSRVDLRALGSDVTITDYDGNGPGCGGPALKSKPPDFRNTCTGMVQATPIIGKAAISNPIMHMSPGMETWGGHWEEISWTKIGGIPATILNGGGISGCGSNCPTKTPATIFRSLSG